MFRSSRWQMLFKIGVLKTFATFTGKHICFHWKLLLKTSENYFWKLLLEILFEISIRNSSKWAVFVLPWKKVGVLKLFCLDTINVFGNSPSDSESTIFYILMIKIFEICKTNWVLVALLHSQHFLALRSSQRTYDLLSLYKWKDTLLDGIKQ